MTIPGTSTSALRMLTTSALAAGLLVVAPPPADAACNSTEVWVEVLGDRTDSPTNGCVGPPGWILLICQDRETQLVDEAVIVGSGACVAVPF